MKKSKIISMFLAISMILGCMSCAWAADITTSGGSATTPVELTATALTFSVTVPTSLSVNVSANGTVTTATNAKIINNGAGPVKVASVTAEAVSPWTLDAWDASDNLSGKKVNTKEFALSIQGAGVKANGSCAAEFDSIAANDEISFTYNAHVAPQATAISGQQMAKVVFTIGWDFFQ